jgi:hypothetical protein
MAHEIWKLSDTRTEKISDRADFCVVYLKSSEKLQPKIKASKTATVTIFLNQTTQNQ